MKYASVCSGVEAASLAWMPLGWQAAWFSEIEPFPCAVLKERFPNVPNLGDMIEETDGTNPAEAALRLWFTLKRVREAKNAQE